MNRDILNVAFEESLDAEAVKQLKAGLSSYEDDVYFHQMPKSAPQASLLLLGVTSVAILFGGAFVKKLGDKAAEDCYPHIKKALSKVYKKYFGKNPQYQIRIVTTSENKTPDTKYSLILALYCNSQDGKAVKFLYETGWTNSQFDEATKVYVESMFDLIIADEGAAKDLLVSADNRIQPCLIAWDADKKALIRVDVLPQQHEKKD